MHTFPLSSLCKIWSLQSIVFHASHYWAFSTSSLFPSFSARTLIVKTVTRFLLFPALGLGLFTHYSIVTIMYDLPFFVGSTVRLQFKTAIYPAFKGIYFSSPIHYSPVVMLSSQDKTARPCICMLSYHRKFG